MSPALLLLIPFGALVFVAGMFVARWQIVSCPQQVGLRRFSDDEHDEAVMRQITARMSAISAEERMLTERLFSVHERVEARAALAQQEAPDHV